MSHLCRSLLPTLLETPGLLSSLMESFFVPSTDLYNDIVSSHMENAFAAFLLGAHQASEDRTITDKTPQELLDEAGYILYECKTKEEVDSFKKYYKENEELCSFREDRLKKCKVFFAVKKNVEEIKRENFLHPERQDEYGTSVISIQFTHLEPNILEIKNRYNHTVDNPDATFSNNLENIIPGLTDSFEKQYHLNVRFQASEFNLPNYTMGSDGRFYKFTHQINDTFYCTNNTILRENDIISYEKERFIVIDYFILDLKEKKIFLYDPKIQDSFVDIFYSIKEVTVQKIENNEKIVKILLDQDQTPIEITLDTLNRIKNVKMDSVKKIGNSFLANCFKVEEFSSEQLKEVGDNFIAKAKHMKKINCENLEIAGEAFLSSAEEIEQLKFNKLKVLENRFCYRDTKLKEVSIENAEIIKDDVFMYASRLENFEANKVKKIGNNFLFNDNKITNIRLDSVTEIGDKFCANAKHIQSLQANQLISVGKNFFESATEMETYALDKLEEAKFGFFKKYPLRNDILQKVEARKNIHLQTIATKSLLASIKDYINFIRKDIEKNLSDEKNHKL